MTKGNGASNIKPPNITFLIGMFSVCIPVFNEEESLSRIYENVKNSTLWRKSARKEMIFCVNGSTDSSERVAREIAGADGSVKLIVLKEKGKNRAWNEMRRRSDKNSDTLFFLDTDVVLPENTLERLSKELERNPGIAAAGAKAAFLREPTKRKEFVRRMIMEAKANPERLTQNFLHGRCYAIRRDEAEKIDMPKDQRIHEDAFLSLKLWGRFAVANDALVYSHAPNMVDALRTHRRTEVSNILIRKHYPKLAPLLAQLTWSDAQARKRMKGKALRMGAKIYRKATARWAVALGTETWTKSKSTKPK